MSGSFVSLNLTGTRSAIRRIMAKDDRISPALESTLRAFAKEISLDTSYYVDKIIELDGDLEKLHDVCVAKVKQYTAKRTEVLRYISEYPPANEREQTLVDSFMKVCDKTIAQWQILAERNSNNHGK